MDEGLRLSVAAAVKQRPLHIIGMGGFGDNVYERAVFRDLATQREIWLSTPYPEFFADLPIRPVRWSKLQLRCQKKNVERTPAGLWTQPPPNAVPLTMFYGLRKPNQTVTQEMEERCRTKIKRFKFDLPDFGPPHPEVRPPYAVIRPASIRQEWTNPARNPDPAYLDRAARMLKERGFQVICLADIDGKQETLVGEMETPDIHWTRGERTPREMVSLVRHATLVVGGVGWIVPTALATRTASVIVCGGLGAHNSPHLLVDKRINSSRMRFLKPDQYCMCKDPRHNCVKTISDFEAKFDAAVTELCA